MTDMASVIVPRSDQINADDLIAGPRTICITGVAIKPGAEQPVAISFAGDEKVWRPCKSMCRILVAIWGPDASQYVGRSVTLYRDPTVKWGGMDVGGIRVSHASHMERGLTMALTATKGQRKPYTVKPLVTDEPAQTWPFVTPSGERHDLKSAAGWDKNCRRAIDAAPTVAALDGWLTSMEPHMEALAASDAAAVQAVRAEAAKRRAALMQETPA